jgi:hypothetical protein
MVAGITATYHASYQHLRAALTTRTTEAGGNAAAAQIRRAQALDAALAPLAGAAPPASAPPIASRTTARGARGDVSRRRT